jgi:hypothetical protein
MKNYIDKVMPIEFVVRRASDRSLLSCDDHIQQVLNDDEPVEIGEFERKDSFDEATSTCGLDVAKTFDDDESFSLSTYVCQFYFILSKKCLRFFNHIVEMKSVE